MLSLTVGCQGLGSHVGWAVCSGLWDAQKTWRACKDNTEHVEAKIFNSKNVETKSNLLTNTLPVKHVLIKM